MRPPAGPPKPPRPRPYFDDENKLNGTVHQPSKAFLKNVRDTTKRHYSFGNRRLARKRNRFCVIS